MDTTGDLNPDPRRLRIARNLRRVGLGVLFALLAVGLAGVIDPSESRVSASNAGVRLTVSYPDRARAGLVSPLEIAVERPGGFRGPIEIAVGRDWLDLFDLGAIKPAPESETADPDQVLWSFEPPPGDRLEVSLDISLRPGSQRSQQARVALIENEASLVSVDFETVVVP